MVWVKFHDKLCKGAKRGLPRAVRFVFMELCLESRPGRGVLDLPVGMSDLDALHDVLGGNRKEIADALKALTAVPRPTANDPEPRAMVELDGEEGTRRLTIPSWEAWNSGQEAPGASTERSRRHRRRPGNATSAEEQHQAEQPQNDDATTAQRPLHPLRTEEQREGNGSATPYRGEEIREEENTNTHRERAHAREDRTIGPSCSEADLAALLAEIPVLADLATDPEAVHDVYTGFVMTAGDTASPELARAALGALIARERLADLSPDGKRERVGTYLANARKYNRDAPRAERSSDTVLVTEDVRVVLEVFGEAWTAKKRRPFVAAVGDEKYAAALVEAARGHAGRLKMRPRDVVRFWAEKYLGDTDKFVADPEHPLRLLPGRLTTYGVPPTKKATVPFAQSPAEKLPEYTPPPAELMAKITKGAA